MSRRLEPGERGEIFYQSRDGGGWLALQYYRDHVGRSRRGKGSGSTQTAAKRAVTRNVDKALAAGGGNFKASTRFEVAMQEWLRSVKTLVDRGSRSPTTYDQYERNARVHVLPAIGNLHLSELTTGRLDRFLSDLHDRKGYSTAKISRTVLSGTCGMLARRDALRSNPVRDVGRLEQGTKAAPRALAVDEVRAFLDLLDQDPYAVRKDLPDLLRFMLATGVRIGEALAVRWMDLDLTSGVVSINGTVVRVKGVGLVRKGTKRETSERLLRLPDWALVMLEGRHDGQSPQAPVFPDSKGGWRDRSNVGRDLRQVRKGTAYAWVKSHTARRTVATLLDGEGMSARVIADQLGHARVSMTQDVYMGRRAVAGAAGHLEALDLGRRATDTAPEEGA